VTTFVPSVSLETGKNPASCGFMIIKQQDDITSYFQNVKKNSA